jgi:hypothetical protein
LGPLWDRVLPRRASTEGGIVRPKTFGDGTWLPEDGNSTDSRNGLLELLQTLANEFREEERQSRDLASRPRKAGDKFARDRITGPMKTTGTVVVARRVPEGRSPEAGLASVHRGVVDVGRCRRSRGPSRDACEQLEGRIRR